jgi:hypothetical protein
MIIMDSSEVIEQEHTDIDYDSDGECIKIVDHKEEQIKDNKEEQINDHKDNKEEEQINDNKEEEQIKDKNKRCLAIKTNGKQCRQTGKPTQSGGAIINGYCCFHRKKN